MSTIPFTEYKLPIEIDDKTLKKIWMFVSIGFHVISVIIALILFTKE